MADWATISSFATGAGTLVLAVATFGSVRSANRSARVAERALQINLRPVLAPARPEDPDQKSMFQDHHWVMLRGGHAVAQASDSAIYLSLGLRNVGAGIAVLQSWYLYIGQQRSDDPRAPVEAFRRLRRDLYVPAGETGFWQGAMRDPSEPYFATVTDAIAERTALTLDLLYTDHEGGQPTTSRFSLYHVQDDDYLVSSSAHFYLDRAGPHAHSDDEGDDAGPPVGWRRWQRRSRH